MATQPKPAQPQSGALFTLFAMLLGLVYSAWSISFGAAFKRWPTATVITIVVLVFVAVHYAAGWGQ